MNDDEALAPNDDPDFADLVAASGKELKRRFDEDPSSLPGTFVIKLWLDGNKAIRAGDAPDNDVPPEPDVFELIQNKGLPLERRKELAMQEKARLAERITFLNDFIYMGEE